MDPARRRARYEDLEKVPEHLVAEIIDGELFASPRPASPHAFTASAIGADLFGRFGRPPGGPEGPGGWWILFEPELHLRRDVPVPDLAGWRRERMPALPNVVGFTLAPDWVCEVISPTTGRLDRVRKMPIYTRERIAHCWLVDPILNTLEAYRLEQGRWVLAAAHTGSGRARVEPFASWEIDLARWWAEPLEMREPTAEYGYLDERELLYRPVEPEPA